MLEYAKVVLLGVCFRELLFKKELIKIISWSQPHEKPEIKRYVYDKYYYMYPDTIDEIFFERKEKELNANTKMIK